MESGCRVIDTLTGTGRFRMFLRFLVDQKSSPFLEEPEKYIHKMG